MTLSTLVGNRCKEVKESEHDDIRDIIKQMDIQLPSYFFYLSLLSWLSSTLYFVVILLDCRVNEFFIIVPTKHFMVWLSLEKNF